MQWAPRADTRWRVHNDDTGSPLVLLPKRVSQKEGNAQVTRLDEGLSAPLDTAEMSFYVPQKDDRLNKEVFLHQGDLNAERKAALIAQLQYTLHRTCGASRILSLSMRHRKSVQSRITTAHITHIPAMARARCRSLPRLLPLRASMLLISVLMATCVRAVRAVQRCAAQSRQDRADYRCV